MVLSQGQAKAACASITQHNIMNDEAAVMCLHGSVADNTMPENNQDSQPWNSPCEGSFGFIFYLLELFGGIMIQTQYDKDMLDMQKPSLALFPDVTESICAGGEDVVGEEKAESASGCITCCCYTFSHIA